MVSVLITFKNPDGVVELQGLELPDDRMRAVASHVTEVTNAKIRKGYEVVSISHSFASEPR